MELSIIIPVYNGAATIGRCLDSIFSQDLEENQYEVICVDDCSPDPSSVSAIENYEYQGIHPPNLILIKHDVNKRQGGARNTGIRVAKGEWIEFVDSDDFIIKGVLNGLLLKAMQHDNLDIITFDYLIGNGTELYSKNHRKMNVSKIMTGPEYHIAQSGPQMPTEALFRKSLLSSNQLWFVENARFEDLDFVIKATILARNVLFVPIDVYYYTKHEGQTTDIGNDIGKIRELYYLSNRMAYNARYFLESKHYRKNGKHLMGYAALNRILYTKRDLWKIGFKDRLSLLKGAKLPFYTGNKAADFIYQHPVVTSLMLIPMNQTLLNMLIKGKKYIKKIYSI